MLVFVNSKSGDNQVRNCFYTGPCYKISTSFRTSCCLMYLLMTFKNLHWLQAGFSCRESYTVYCCTGIFPHQGLLLLLLQIISYFCGLKCNIGLSLLIYVTLQYRCSFFTQTNVLHQHQCCCFQMITNPSYK